MEQANYCIFDITRNKSALHRPCRIGAVLGDPLHLGIIGVLVVTLVVGAGGFGLLQRNRSFNINRSGEAGMFMREKI